MRRVYEVVTSETFMLLGSALAIGLLLWALLGGALGVLG